MAILFWRKQRDLGHGNESQSVPVSENDPLPIQIISTDEDDVSTVSINQATPGTTNLVHVAGITGVPNSTQADQRLTVDSTAGGVQFGAFHADTLYVYWTCEDAQCRVTFDNSAPTSTNGHIINVGDSGLWLKNLATAAKFIRTGGTSAVLHASQLQ